MTGFSELPVELLDAILQHINIKTLLFAQLVSRTWHNAIASSPQLQEDLFFRPKIPKHPNYTCVWTKEKLDYFGPPRDITNTSSGFTSTSTSTSKTTSQTYNPIRINGLLVDAIRIQTLNFRSSHVRGQCLDLSRLKKLFSRRVGRSHAACCRPEAVGSKADAAERRWTVTFLDTVQLGHLAIKGRIVRFVDGRGLVPTDMKCRGNPNEMRAKVAHPNLPVFR